MARSAKLIPWRALGLVLLLVLLLHVAVLEWAARQGEQLSLLEKMATPMYTRLLKPAEPPPIVAEAVPEPPARPKARAVVAVKPRPKASEPKPEPRPEVAPPPEPAPEPAPPQVAQAPVAEAPRVEAPAEAPAPEPPPAQAAETPTPEVPVPPPLPPPPAQEQVASAVPPQPAASAPAPAASAPVAENGNWPGDTRLSYQLGGQYRGGPLYGDARVQWQRSEERYQVRLDVDIRFLFTYTMTSQGQVTAAGLKPRAYEEYRPGKRRIARFGDEVVTLDNGKTAPRPPGLQDTVSQFVELAHRFSSGKSVLEVGRTVTVPLGRPGAVDIWTYDIVERVLLRTPKMGTVEAFHLKPRPMVNPRGNIYAEMWFAPSLQYLPVRIQVRMGEVDYLDLVVEKIEQ